MIQKLLFLLLVLALLFVFFRLIKHNANKQEQTVDNEGYLHYRKIASLFTPAEQHFLIALESAIDHLPVRLFAKVRLADIVKVDQEKNQSQFWAAFNKISSKHIDFLLVHPNSFSPLLAIELDDASHNSEKRKKRDNFVDDVLQQTNIPLLRIPAASKYSSSLIQDLIKNYIG